MSLEMDIARARQTFDDTLDSALWDVVAASRMDSEYSPKGELEKILQAADLYAGRVAVLIMAETVDALEENDEAGN